jgi:hypothetical protein
MKRLISILFAAGLMAGCGTVQDFLPTIQKDLVDGPVTLVPGKTYQYPTKRPRTRKRDYVGVYVVPSEKIQARGPRLETTTGQAVSLSVSITDSTGTVQRLSQMYYSRDAIFYAVKPTPPQDRIFTNVTISCSETLTVDRIIWQHQEYQ